MVYLKTRSYQLQSLVKCLLNTIIYQVLMFEQVFIDLAWSATLTQRNCVSDAVQLLYKQVSADRSWSGIFK